MLLKSSAFHYHLKKVEMNIIHTSFAPDVAVEIVEDIGASVLRRSEIRSSVLVKHDGQVFVSVGGRVISVVRKSHALFPSQSRDRLAHKPQPRTTPHGASDLDLPRSSFHCC